MAKTRTIGKVEAVQKKWLSAKEAMAYLGCGRTFLTALRNDAKISFARFGEKMYWYDLASIDKFLERSRVVPTDLVSR